MAFFDLELDTTSPIVTIVAPEYIYNGHSLEFTATANEDIDSSMQEAKVFDDQGTLYNVTMTYNPTTKTFTGVVPNAIFKTSLATIEVSLWDEVHNKGTDQEDVRIVKAVFKVCVEIIQFPHELSVEEVTECL